MSAQISGLGVATAALVAALVAAWRVGLAPVSMPDTLELWTLDARFELRGDVAIGDEVVLVAYDDATLEKRPDLFERRAGIARVIRAMHAGGARVIGVDLLFADREELLPADLVAEIDAWVAAHPEAEPTDLLGRVAAEAHGDDELAAAIRDAGNVVLGMHVGYRGNEPDKGIGKAKYGQVSAGAALPVAFDRVIVSEPLFVKAASRMGMISVFEDSTGAVRDVPLGAGLGQSVVVPFAVALVAEYRGVPRGNVAYVGETGAVHVGDEVLASGDEGRLWLHWRGTPFPVVSAMDVVEGRAGAALQDRIAILGFTHLAEDTLDTPFGREAGFTAHATAIDQLLHGDRLVRARPATDALVTLLAGVAAAALFVTRLRPTVQVFGAVAVIALAAAGTHVALADAHVWVTAIGPVSSAALTAGLCFAVGYLQEGVARRHLRRAFSHYLSDELVEELVSDPSRVSLTGDRKELTVLFTDIRNFTTFAERIAPLELAAFLRTYFDPMTRAVMAHDGYVDKFIGDAVMAIFGAPVRRDDHAIRACATAIAMFRALEGVRPGAERLGIDLHIGAGINTGEMVVGNLGSAERFDYTVLGDAVNLGSRLESLTKQYGVFCLVGPKTAAAARAACVFRPVDLVRVKGKHEPIELSELCAGPGGAIATYVDVEGFGAAMAAWRRGDLAAARQGFMAFAAKNPADPVAKMYLERIDELGGAVPAGWDGVFTHTKK